MVVCVAVKMETINPTNTPRLIHECQILRKLDENKVEFCVPRVYWFGYAFDSVYLVMDLFGPTLRAIVRTEKTLTLSRVKSIGHQLISIIDFTRQVSFTAISDQIMYVYEQLRLIPVSV